MATKSELEATVVKLQKQLAAVNGSRLCFSGPYFDILPTGKTQDICGHPFEDVIRELAYEQWDGHVYHKQVDDCGTHGWMYISVRDTPLNAIMARVTYTDKDGVFVHEFCPCVCCDN